MYVIKHHNIIQSDMPSHIREMAKESYLNIFAKLNDTTRDDKKYNCVEYI